MEIIAFLLMKLCLIVSEFRVVHNYVVNFQGQRLMMMGTADEMVKAPEKEPVFVEDLPEEEQVVALVWFLELTPFEFYRIF